MSLSVKTAGRIAWRETRASSAKFLFVVLAVAAGVGALSGVQGFSTGFRSTLLDQSRTIMAADLTARQFAPASEAEQAAIDKLSARGVEYTLITETISMAAAANAAANSDAATPVLVSIKAVDPGRYPYYGEVKLEPAGDIKSTLTPEAVTVAQDVLLRLSAKVGDSLRIGTGTFKIAAVTASEPDRMSGSMNVGLRLLMSRDAFERSGLMGFGSRGAYRYLFKMKPGSPDVEAVRTAIKSALPEALISDFRQSNPIITRGLERATVFLSLVSLIAMIVGALGVGMAMHAHLQQKMDNIAVMKSLGASSRDVIRIFLLQTLLLGFLGGIAGAIVGRIIERVLPVLISSFFKMDIVLGWNWWASAQGVMVGVLTTLLFTLPPLLSIRKIRPALILRRDMPDAKRSWAKRISESGSAAVSGVLIIVGLGAIAGWLAESAQVGGYFAGGLVASLILLAAVASLLLRGIRSLVKNAPLRIPTLARQGFANLYRQGNQARSILVALGLGVMFTLTVYLVQHSLVGEIMDSAPPDAPNVFMIGITPDQVGPLKALIAKQKGVLNTPEFAPSVPIRIELVNGKPLDELRSALPELRREGEPPSPRFPRRIRANRTVMFSDNKPTSIRVVQGAWWKPGEAQPVVSLEEDAAFSLGVKLGDSIEISGGAHAVNARVAALHRQEQMRIGGANEFVFNAKALEGFPATFYGGIRMKASEVGALEREAYKVFPTVTIINVAEALAIVQQVVDQVALVIRFLSAFAILAGAIILAASVAGTRFRRVREVVILKTLGATRASVGKIFSVEFLTLGVVAGLMGAILATAFSRILLIRLLDAQFTIDWKAALVAIAFTALLAQVSGWLASFKIMRQKPLEVLRDE